MEESLGHAGGERTGSERQDGGVPSPVASDRVIRAAGGVDICNMETAHAPVHVHLLEGQYRRCRSGGCVWSSPGMDRGVASGMLDGNAPMSMDHGLIREDMVVDESVKMKEVEQPDVIVMQSMTAGEGDPLFSNCFNSVGGGGSGGMKHNHGLNLHMPKEVPMAGKGCDRASKNSIGNSGGKTAVGGGDTEPFVGEL